MTAIARRVLGPILGTLLCLTAVPAAKGQEEEQVPDFKPEEIEQLVAPIALYPDGLLAQVLMASTYPLEIVQADRWAKAHPGLQGTALEDALREQRWDPSVKSLVALPEVLAMMDDKLDWTQSLGDAFLAQQADVMGAVQRLRARALAEGRLYSTNQQTVVEQKTADQTRVIKIEPTNPEVIYVPIYDPFLVYGAWPYPAYPPYYYYPPGYVAAPFISFGFGLAVGHVIWGGCDWHHHHVHVDVKHYNDFNHTNIHDGRWHHDAAHRRGVAYRDPPTQNRYARPGPGDPQAREPFRGRAEPGRHDLGGAGAGGLGAERARPPGAFQGIGHGAETRLDSSRGNVSRGSSSSWGSQGGSGGGTSRGGGGGGGGRSGGGMSRGGGGRGGGGGRR